MNPYVIVTERLGLRRWYDSDIEPFSKMNRDADVMRYFPKLLTEEESFAMMQRIKLHFQKNDFGLFAVEKKLTEQFIGFTGFNILAFESFFTPCVEIGWRYKKEVWGNGFATEAASACLRYGFEDLKFDKIVSLTSSLNKNSERLMRRIGMTYVTEFDHPNIEKENILCRHVLYRIPGA